MHSIPGPATDQTTPTKVEDLILGMAELLLYRALYLGRCLQQIVGKPLSQQQRRDTKNRLRGTQNGTLAQK